jgi:hypothetical protein
MYCEIIINRRVKELREKGTKMATSLKNIRINVFYYIDDIIHLMQKLVKDKKIHEARASSHHFWTYTSNLMTVVNSVNMLSMRNSSILITCSSE